MATLTMTSPATTNAGSSYAQNVGRAARALLAAILAIHSTTAPATTTRTIQEPHRSQSDDMALYQLYSLAAPYDVLMPNLAQELRVMASRDQ